MGFWYQGWAYFPFGDIVSQLDKALDTIVTTEAHNPELGVRLDFSTVPGRPCLTIEPPGISIGAFETPAEDISLRSEMYVVVRTNHFWPGFRGPRVVIRGTARYRHSDSFVGRAGRELRGQGTLYFTGLKAGQTSTWSQNESDAKPIIRNGTMGDIS
jgi:hypothetical protein